MDWSVVEAHHIRGLRSGLGKPTTPPPPRLSHIRGTGTFTLAKLTGWTPVLRTRKACKVAVLGVDRMFPQVVLPSRRRNWSPDASVVHGMVALKVAN